MNKVLIIFKHEFKQITKGKVFLIMTLLGPLLFAAFSIIPSYFAMKSSETQKDAKIAIYAQDEILVKYIEENLLKQNLQILVAKDLEDGKSLVLQEKSKGFAVIPKDIINADVIDYYSTTGTDFQYSNEVEKVIQNYVNRAKKQELGLSIKESDWLAARIGVNNYKISDNGDVDDSNFESILIISIIISALIMMTVLIYGLSAARAVLSEKTSKTVELLLSSVRPIQILIGKVLGAGSAGLLQFSAWILMAILAVKFLTPYIDVKIPTNIFTLQILTSIFIYFIFGVLFYMFIYAAIGANVENEQNFTQAQIPLQLILMLPFMLSSSIISNPNSSLAVFLSYLPFTSPTIMPIRILVDNPGPLKVIISMVILLLSLCVVLYGSAKLFKIGLLIKGKKTNFIQIILRLFQK